MFVECALSEPMVWSEVVNVNWSNPRYLESIYAYFFLSRSEWKYSLYQEIITFVPERRHLIHPRSGADRCK